MKLVNYLTLRTFSERSAIYNIVSSTFIKAIQLNEHEKKVVVVKLTPRYTGLLQINAVVGKISVGLCINLYLKKKCIYF